MRDTIKTIYFWWSIGFLKLCDVHPRQVRSAGRTRTHAFGHFGKPKARRHVLHFGQVLGKQISPHKECIETKPLAPHKGIRVFQQMMECAQAGPAVVGTVPTVVAPVVKRRVICHRMCGSRAQNVLVLQNHDARSQYPGIHNGFEHVVVNAVDVQAEKVTLANRTVLF